MKSPDYLFALTMLAISLYGLYGLVRRGFARRHYEETRRRFPFMLIGPLRNARFYTVAYAIIVVLALIAIVWLFVVPIVQRPV